MTEPMVDDALVEKVGLALLNDDRTRNGYPPVAGLDHLADEDADAYRGSARAAIAIAYPAGVAAGREESRAKVTSEVIDAGARIEATLHKINGHWWNKRIRPDARDLRVLLDFVVSAIRQRGE